MDGWCGHKPENGVTRKERWLMTGDDGEEPSMTIAATPDDGTSPEEKKKIV